MARERARGAVLFEAAAVAVFAALFVRLALASAPVAASAPWLFALGAGLGALAADLVSGVGHWVCDRFGSEDTPLVGRSVIASFREHHRDPSAMMRHGVLERSGANALLAIPVAAAADAGVEVLGTGAEGAFALGAALALSALVALTNEIHLQAHRARPARAIALLQRLRLVLPPEEHARHHRGPHDRAYCITNGWSNALLERLGVFDWIERRVGRRA